MCPTIMFTVRRTVKLNGFEQNDMISIGIKIGAIAHGVPCGKKFVNQFNPRFFNPMTTVIKIENTDSAPTAAKWLV